MGNENITDVDGNSIPKIVSFSQHVWPIIKKYCVDCHSSTAKYGAFNGISYNGYSDIAYVNLYLNSENKSGFLGIKETGISEKSMPPGSKEKFSPLEVEILLKWERQGKLNN